MVAARETTLQELLEGSKQYQVPLYQRTSSWKNEQLKQLWEDITQLADDRVEDPERADRASRITTEQLALLIGADVPELVVPRSGP